MCAKLAASSGYPECVKNPTHDRSCCPTHPPPSVTPEEKKQSSIKCGLNFFIYRIWIRGVFWLGPPAPKMLGSDSKPHFESRCCAVLTCMNRAPLPEQLEVLNFTIYFVSCDSLAIFCGACTAPRAHRLCCRRARLADVLPARARCTRSACPPRIIWSPLF